jgi:hypothetical protein
LLNQTVTLISDFFILIFDSKLFINLVILKGFSSKFLIINLIKPLRNQPHPSTCHQVKATRLLKSHLPKDNALMKKVDLPTNPKMKKPQKPPPMTSLQPQNKSPLTPS